MVAVHSIELSSFGPYDDALLKLPERGLVLITGENGSGKTTFMQAVATGIWGKTVIGDEMWVDFDDAAHSKAKSQVDIVIADPVEGRVDVSRWRTKKGTKSLKWGATNHATTSKAQADLEALVGTMDVWRWSSVFVNDAPDLFTRATDKARKQLLESAIPNLDRFDPALKHARQLAKAGEMQRDAARTAEARHNAAAAAARAALAASEPPRPTDAEVTAAEREYDAAQKSYADAAALVEELRETQAQAAYQASEDDSDLRVTRRRIEDLKAGACPTCGKNVPPEERSQLHRDAAELAARVEAARTAAAAEQARVGAMLTKVEVAAGEAWAKLQTAQAQHQALIAQVRSHDAWKTRTAGDKGQAAADEQAATEAAAKAEEAAEEVRYLEAAQKVLGLRGARARVLGQVLEAIDAAANRWLDALAGDGWAVQLRAYSEQKSGKIDERISLQVQAPDRPGKWRGYWSSSSGQRRRFDIAVMLGIGDVVRGLRGGARSTMFFDEVLHALDERGKAAAVDMMHDLARETCVVVVSHDPDVLTRLRPDLHVQVDGGRIL